LGQKYQKGVFYHCPRRLPADNGQLDVGVFSRRDLQTGLEVTLAGFEFSMGRSNGAQPQPVIGAIFNAPLKNPVAPLKPLASVNLLDADLRRTVTHVAAWFYDSGF
jgi:hypothetical protein